MMAIRAFRSFHKAAIFSIKSSEVLKRTHRFNKMTSTSPEMVAQHDVAAMRINYKSEGLKMDEIEIKEPIVMFDKWFKMAKECAEIKEANAMSLATVSKDGKPSVRIVLLKGYSKQGFRFFTNYSSRKGQEIENNPNVAILFYWEPLERQVRIEGRVSKLASEESASYFKSRPRASQLGALASNQSTTIPNKKFLEQRYADLEKTYKSVEIPMPDWWGGYELTPDYFEFWCGGKGRMHDRVVFTKKAPGNVEHRNEHCKDGDNGWQYEYISP